jgi:hypothetical protein
MKTVHELNAEELQELRSRWYQQHLDNNSSKDEENVPMDIVMRDYEGTYFVEEDFFCNL